MKDKIQLDLTKDQVLKYSCDGKWVTKRPDCKNINK